MAPKMRVLEQIGNASHAVCAALVKRARISSDSVHYSSALLTHSVHSHTQKALLHIYAFDATVPSTTLYEKVCSL